VSAALRDTVDVADNEPNNRILRWLPGGASTWWRTAVGIIVPVVLMTAIAVTVLLLTIDVTNNASARIELIKTGLSVGAGTGGIIVLVLTGRKYSVMGWVGARQ
jgi:hypothetical protein